MNKLKLGPFFFLDNTRGIEDIYLWLLDETSDLSARHKMIDSINLFKKLDDNHKIEEVIKNINILCADQNIPCLIDQGGMLEDNGRYKNTYVTIMDKIISQEEDYYVALIHRRKPIISGLPFRDNLLVQKVEPLKDLESSILLNQLITKYNIKVTKEMRKALIDITPFIGGYPPAAYFAATTIREYGIMYLLQDRHYLVDFKARRFTRFLIDLALSDVEWNVLKYLSSEKIIPLAALSLAARVDGEKTSQILRKLIDLNLVIMIEDNYTITPPIRDAIFRVKGFLEKDFFERVAKDFTNVFWKDKRIAPSIEIIDATLNAIARSGSTDFAPYQELVRVSTIHRLAEELYHEGEWEQALFYAQRAELIDPNRAAVRSIILKSLVQMEKWDKAEKKLSEIFEKRDKKAFYLKGFMLKRLHKQLEAISAFESAIEIGDKGFDVYRDYADCLHRVGRSKEAFDIVEEILIKRPDDIYYLDLIVRICIDLKDFLTANTYLNDLKRFDINEKFIHHRYSRFYSEQRLWDLALTEAKLACDTGHARFAANAQKADIMIELGQYSDAKKEIDYLTYRFRTHNQDIQIGLNCKLFIRQGKWQEALTIWDKLIDKNREVHLALLASIFDLKSNDYEISLAERDLAKKQAEEIRTRIEREFWGLNEELDEGLESKENNTGMDNSGELV